MAQNNLGYMYQNGKGVEQDYAKARELYEQAATRGIARAYYHLGEMYENGRGMNQDYAKAAEYYEKAAAKGDTDAQKNLDRLRQKISADKSASQN